MQHITHEDVPESRGEATSLSNTGAQSNLKVALFVADENSRLTVEVHNEVDGRGINRSKSKRVSYETDLGRQSKARDMSSDSQC